MRWDGWRQCISLLMLSPSFKYWSEHAEGPCWLWEVSEHNPCGLFSASVSRSRVSTVCSWVSAAPPAQCSSSERRWLCTWGGEAQPSQGLVGPAEERCGMCCRQGWPQCLGSGAGLCSHHTAQLSGQSCSSFSSLQCTSERCVCALL